MSYIRALLISGLIFCAAGSGQAQQLDAAPKPDRCTQKASGSDGVHCIILSSRVVTKPRGACGKSESGRSQDASVLVQHLRYESWRNGKLISTWYDNREILQVCLEE